MIILLFCCLLTKNHVYYILVQIRRIILAKHCGHLPPKGVGHFCMDSYQSNDLLKPKIHSNT